MSQLNFTDNISTLVCCLTIAFGIVLNNYSESHESELVIYSTVGFINLSFLIYISSKILSSYWFIFKQKIEPYLSKILVRADRNKLI